MPRSQNSLAAHALAGAFFLGTLCGGMTSFVVALYFASLGHGELLVTGIFVAGAVAEVFAAPFLAPLFDKFSALKLSVAANVLELALLVLFCAFPHPALLIAGTFALSAVTGISIPAVFVLAEAAAPEQSQAKIFSLLDTARFTGGLFGPVIGGALMTQSSIRTTLGLEACSVAVSLAVLVGIGALGYTADFSAEENSQGGFLHRLLEAPKLLLTTDSARQVLTSIWAAIIFTSIFNVTLVFFATQVLEISGFMYAVVAQCFVVGRIVGANWAGRMGLNPGNAVHVLLRRGVIMGICIAMPGLFPSLALSLICFFGGGVCNALQVAALRLVIIGAVPPAIKPKALSTMGSVNNSAMLVGYVVGGPVTAATTPAVALAVSGLGTALVTACAATVRRFKPQQR